MASKIKVDTIENVAGSGNVSLGSGHNLVVPGNITGQGTAAITSNATVGGTLGVTGATSLTAQTDTGVVKFRTATAPTFDQNSYIYGESGFGMNIESSAVKFNVGSSRVETMRIDANGRITKPKQPSFSVRSNAGNNGNTWEQGQDIKFQLVDRNNGSHYAAGTGRFTAPVAGFYHFNYIGFGYSAGRIPAASTTSVQIRKNGTAVIAGAYVEVNTSTGYPNCGFSFSLLLAVNDYVTIRAQSQGQYADASGLYTSFSGFLVG